MTARPVHTHVWKSGVANDGHRYTICDTCGDYRSVVKRLGSWLTGRGWR